MVNASAAVSMARTYTLGQLGTFADTGFISSAALSLSIPTGKRGRRDQHLECSSQPGAGHRGGPDSRLGNAPLHRVLGIELISPSGKRSVLKNIFDGFSGADLNGMVLLSNAFYGENPAGVWTIKVVDADAIADSGTLPAGAFGFSVTDLQSPTSALEPRK